MKFKTLMTTTVIATAMAMPQLAMSEVSQQSGSGTLSAPVNLDFQVVIPGFLDFQVGALGATIDEIVFTVPIANIGDGTDIAGTGGDLGSGTVTVDVFSNKGQITITETNNSGGAGLTDGTDFIPYTEILTATNNVSLPFPALSDAGGNTSLPALAGKVTNESAIWTYTYDNFATPPAGTYGGVGGGGRVTYTAASP